MRSMQRHATLRPVDTLSSIQTVQGRRDKRSGSIAPLRAMLQLAQNGFSAYRRNKQAKAPPPNYCQKLSAGRLPLSGLKPLLPPEMHDVIPLADRVALPELNRGKRAAVRKAHVLLDHDDYMRPTFGSPRLD